MPKVDPDSKIERRYFQAQGMEVRAEGDDEPAVLMGYAALFDETSEDLGGFRERIAQGAFANTIGGDIRALFNHDTNLILGRTKANTLRLLEDQRGLRCEITLPDTNTARDLRESVRLGNVDQMSFGFRTKALDASKAVSGLLEGYRGGPVQGVFLKAIRDGIEGDTSILQRVSLTFSVTYRD